jgi:hypothetical protein
MAVVGGRRLSAAILRSSDEPHAAVERHAERKIDVPQESEMNQKDFFATKLGAPLVNVRWSWGAIRELDTTVFLRVWDDEVQTREGREFVRVCRAVSQVDSTDLGHRERIKHVDRVRGGARCYLVMCTAVDPAESARRVRQFNDKEVFIGGAVEQFDDHWWIERLSAVSVGEVAAAPGIQGA